MIGDKLAYRKKQMFTVPVGEWFRNTLSSFTEEVLLDQRTTERDLFRPEVIREMLAAHQMGTSNYTRELRALISVELWCRIFLDTQDLSSANWDSIGIDTRPYFT